ncbi:hypothetical protein FE634_00915 [Nocardioides dongxiaopingii]|nr:hypothetical protein FE634_00915 [Nocardioides sp. S-1144]
MSRLSSRCGCSASTGCCGSGATRAPTSRWRRRSGSRCSRRGPRPRRRPPRPWARGTGRRRGRRRRARGCCWRASFW